MYGAKSVRQRTDFAPLARETRMMTVYGDMTKQLLKDLMSCDVEVVGPDMSIAEAARHVRDGDFGLLPVGVNDRMVGTISDRDITIRAVAAGKDTAIKVREVMSAGVTWAPEDDSVEQAVKVMSKRQVRRLPVLDCAMVHVRRRTTSAPVPAPEVACSVL